MVLLYTTTEKIIVGIEIIGSVLGVFFIGGVIVKIMEFIYGLPLISELKILFSSLDPEAKNYLSETFPFYNQLKKTNQNKLFEKRLAIFLKSKKFIGRQGKLEVDYRTKILISATAVKVAFGYRYFNYDFISRILVYPTEYFSEITGKYHIGEVNTNGLIVISDFHLKDGYLNCQDGINLAVHELSHAFFLQNFKSTGYRNFFEQKDINLLKEHFFSEQSNSYFREYSKTNLAEFFAVVSEYFFEKSDDFENKKPELFQLFRSFYNQ